MMVLDRVSALPDSLITQILLYLPTKDTVKTSLLSTRWRNLWLDVPGLEFHSSDVRYSSEVAINNFIDRFLKFKYKLRLQKFRLVNDLDNFTVPSDYSLNEWIAIAVDRGIKDLNVNFKNVFVYGQTIMPMNIYKSRTLVSLKLAQVGLKNPEFVVSLPCLKIMHLEDIWRGHHFCHLTIEKLLLGCPVLEDLTFVKNCYSYENPPLLRVRSNSLKIFRLTFNWSSVFDDFSVEIDAPGLKYLSFRDTRHAMMVVKDLKSLFKIDIDAELNPSLKKKKLIYNFLNAISNVKHMIISQRTLQVIFRYSRLLPIPNFHNLSHLQAAFSSLFLDLLPTFLESCPNLKNLMLDFSVSWEPKYNVLTYVPRCLSFTLEYVEINKLTTWERNGIKLVRYILENSAVLKKLNLSVTNSSEASDMDGYEELIRSIKCPQRCQIELSC